MNLGNSNSTKNNSRNSSAQNGINPRIKASANPYSAPQQSASRNQKVYAEIAKNQAIHGPLAPSALNTNKQIKSNSNNFDTFNAISMDEMSPLITTKDYGAILQATRPALQRAEKTAKAMADAIDISPMVNAFKPIALKYNRLAILTKAQWPMHLVENQKACERIDSLPEGIEDEELKYRISEIAYECLNEKWLDETKALWQSHNELSDGEMHLLLSALERHRNKDYEGCVSLLMNLFEGLIEKYAPQIKSLGGEQTEMFNAYAEQLGLKGTTTKDKPRNLNNIKDKVLMILISSESGWLALDKAVDYLVKVTLANRMNSDLAAHNPLRNKICHGEQTEFGTLEHSLKSILVTDLMIRYGSALLGGHSLDLSNA